MTTRPLYRIEIRDGDTKLATWERFADTRWTAKQSAREAAEREYPTARKLRVDVLGTVSR